VRGGKGGLRIGAPRAGDGDTVRRACDRAIEHFALHAGADHIAFRVGDDARETA